MLKDRVDQLHPVVVVGATLMACPYALSVALEDRTVTARTSALAYRKGVGLDMAVMPGLLAARTAVVWRDYLVLVAIGARVRIDPLLLGLGCIADKSRSAECLADVPTFARHSGVDHGKDVWQGCVGAGDQSRQGAKQGCVEAPALREALMENCLAPATHMAQMCLWH